MLTKRFIFCVMLASMVCAGGCVSWMHASNPLKDWKMGWSQDPDKINKAIRDDYQDYVRHLPARKRKYVGMIFLLEDGAGQHAVKIEIDFNGTWLEHALIYDRENRRIKVIKFVGGHYAC